MNVAPADTAVQLRTAGMRFKAWPVKPTPLGNGAFCEAPGGVAISRGSTAMRFSKPLRVNGAFALRLLRFEKVIGIDHLGTYGASYRVDGT